MNRILYFVLYFLLLYNLESKDIVLTFKPLWSTKPVAIDSAVFNNAYSQKIKITRLSFLISEFTFIKPDGAIFYLKDKYAFIDAESNQLSITLSGVPEGDYASLRFKIGLPESVDLLDASTWDPGHPLNPIVNKLYWGWRAGYVHFAIEGLWSDSKDLNDVERGFSYHIARDAGNMSVDLGVPFSTRDLSVINLKLDISGLLRRHKFDINGNYSSTHSRPDDLVAKQFARLISLSVGWSGVSNLSRSYVSSSKNTHTESNNTDYAFYIPTGFPKPELPKDNILTTRGIALGKKLFSDTRLSGNGTQSCETCHNPLKAYASSNKIDLSAEGYAGTRNTPSIMNLAWSSKFGWDGTKNLMRDQILSAIVSKNEMNGSVNDVLTRLNKDPEITNQFKEVFGDIFITADRLTKVIEQYILTITSHDSKFDRAMKGQVSLTDDEKRGFKLFITEYDPVRGQYGADCFHCHGGALFTDFSERDNGLDISASDKGKFNVTRNSLDKGRFKTPSLRNCAITAPYMHDGRFKTLADVIDHYNSPPRRNLNLDPNIAKHPDKGIGLTKSDEDALVAFLVTLTDARFTDSKY